MNVCQTVALLGLATLASCITRFEYAELDAGEQQMAIVWATIDRIAKSDGFRPDAAETDRGLRVYQTRWRRRQGLLGHPRRERLRVEVQENESGEGWIVRYYVEQQEVEDLTKASEPAERDWSHQGQNSEYQERFAARLARALGLIEQPKADAPLKFGR